MTGRNLARRLERLEMLHAGLCGSSHEFAV
jgi:hypothetical protein